MRHTVTVPLEVHPLPARQRATTSVNMGEGGLAFLLDACVDTGTVVQVRIPTVQPPFEAAARVVWCRPEQDRFLVGVAFLDAGAAFQVRMVEQVCAIEEYRREIRQREGRELTSQQAAEEWIAKYAPRF